MNRKTAYKKRMAAFAGIMNRMGKVPSPRLAFNLVNFQDYKHNFLSSGISHLAQVCVFEQLILLSHIAIKKHGLTYCYHSNEQFEQGTGLGRKTVNKIVALLETKGVVSKTRLTPTKDCGQLGC